MTAFFETCVQRVANFLRCIRYSAALSFFCLRPAGFTLRKINVLDIGAATGLAQGNCAWVEMG